MSAPEIIAPEIVAESLTVGPAAAPRLVIDRLCLAPGARVAIVGPSGAGKSTLLLALAGVPASTGRVLWDGVDLLGLGPAARARLRRRRLGLLLQDIHLVPELSPRANALLPAGFDRWRAGPALAARADMLLARFEAPTDRRRAADLSRGERQRVGLARALLRGPEVLFLDEPTASLDAAAAARVVDALLGLADAEGFGLVVASHDGALIERLGGRIALERGRLAA